MTQLLKAIENVNYSEDTIKGSFNTVSGGDLSFTMAPLTGSSYSHMWMGPLFSVPVNSIMRAPYTVDYSDGGYIRTAMEYLVTDVGDNIIIADISSDVFGMSIDGLDFNITIPLDATATGATSGLSTTTLYGAYMKTPLYYEKSTSGPCSTSVIDNLISEQSIKVTTEISEGLPMVRGVNPESNEYFNSGIIYLFSDDIQKPNVTSATTATTNSWSTGNGLDNPYTIGKKFPFNFITDELGGYYVDKPIGAVDLLGGIVTIFNQDIVDAFDFSVGTGGTGTTLVTFASSLANSTFKSVDIEQKLNMTLIAGKNEFTTSNNPTWDLTTCDGKIYVTYIDFYDEQGNLVAKGVTDSPLSKQKNEQLIIEANISF